MHLHNFDEDVINECIKLFTGKIANLLSGGKFEYEILDELMFALSMWLKKYDKFTYYTVSTLQAYNELRLDKLDLAKLHCLQAFKWANSQENLENTPALSLLVQKAYAVLMEIDQRTLDTSLFSNMVNSEMSDLSDELQPVLENARASVEWAEKTLSLHDSNYNRQNLELERIKLIDLETYLDPRPEEEVLPKALHGYERCCELYKTNPDIITLVSIVRNCRIVIMVNLAIKNYPEALRYATEGERYVRELMEKAPTNAEVLLLSMQVLTVIASTKYHAGKKKEARDLVNELIRLSVQIAVLNPAQSTFIRIYDIHMVIAEMMNDLNNE